MATSPGGKLGASWFETRRFAALLTMRGKGVARIERSEIRDLRFEMRQVLDVAGAPSGLPATSPRDELLKTRVCCGYQDRAAVIRDRNWLELIHIILSRLRF
jgi:hypothetical protein